MKKLKKAIFIFSIVMICFFKLQAVANNFDEFWNFNMARNFSYGNLPYKDFNMIIFPLFPMFISCFFRIFGEEFIVYRILGGLSCIIGIILSWKILEKLKLENYIIMYLIVSIYFIMMSLSTFEYNFASLILALVIILIEFSNPNHRKRFLIGVILGLIILTKQSIGIVVSVFSVISIFVLNKKKSFKDIFIECIGILIPILFWIIYLIKNNIINEFIDYTFLSANNFLENGKTSLAFLGCESFFVLVIICISIISFFITKNKDDKSKVLFLYSMSMLIISFPILDFYHLIMSVYLFIILLFYMIYLNGIQDIYSYIEKFNKTCLVVFYLISFIMIILYGILEINKSERNYLKHFKFINFYESYQKNIEIVDEYLEANENVYILDAYSVIYMIPLDRYNNFFDMPLIRKFRKRW